MKRLFTWGAPLFAFLALTLSLFSQADTKPSTIDSTSANYQQATLAGGCFWCTESDMEKLPGVVDVISGYAGGDVDNPTYKQVSSGKTGHIEVIQVTFDPKIVSYEQVLDNFFRHIDPTDDQGSFVDRGEQYRPAIFYHNAEQLEVAKRFMMEIDQLGIFKKPLKTELIEFKKFWPAEDYHQDYYKKNKVRYNYYAMLPDAISIWMKFSALTVTRIRKPFASGLMRKMGKRTSKLMSAHRMIRSAPN